jgi:anti-anti-sigma factor
MPTTPKPHLAQAVHQGVLVLTVLEPQLQGDRQVTALRHELDRAVAPPDVRHVVLDLHEVKALSSAAFRPLLSLRHDLERRGSRLVLCNLAPVVAEAFRATRLLSTSRASAASFEVQPTLSAAVASLRPAAEELPEGHAGEAEG